jgi:hypothetical protein
VRRTRSGSTRCASTSGCHGATAPLRYFTLSGGDPLDVIALLERRVLVSDRTGLSTVHFFDRLQDNPQPMILDLPGAQCFGGPFVQTILAADSGPSEDAESEEYNRQVILASTKRRFRQFFPFDVINLDWEELLLEASERGAECLAEALTQLFTWQAEGADDARTVNGFSLTLSSCCPDGASAPEEFVDGLCSAIGRNLAALPELRQLLHDRCGVSHEASLAAAAWPALLQIGIPKVVTSALRAAGWTICVEPALRVVERLHQNGSVSLHVLLDVERSAEGADESYRLAMRGLFIGQPDIVQGDVRAEVRRDLNRARRKRKKLREGPLQL